MAIQNNLEIMEFMVWVVELVAEELFHNDKTTAYITLKENEIWDLFIDTYDVTHTLGAEYLLNDIREILAARGVIV